MTIPSGHGASSRRFWEAVAVIWSAAVISLATTPIRNVEMITSPVSDKVLHALAFLVGCIVWAGTFEDKPGQFRSLGLAAAVCLGMGGLIELLQSQTTTRNAETGDLVADAVGILLGACVWILISFRKQRRLSSLNPVESAIEL